MLEIAGIYTRVDVSVPGYEEIKIHVPSIHVRLCVYPAPTHTEDVEVENGIKKLVSSPQQTQPTFSNS